MNQQFILKTELMENYDRTMELVETAQNSAGKSDEQFAKYTDTLEYKVKQLKGSWEELRQSFLKSDFLKNAVDWINKLVDKLTNLNLKDFALLGTLGLTVGKSSLQKMIQTYQDSFNKIGKATSKLKEKMYGKNQEVDKKSQEQKNAEEATKVYVEGVTKAGQSLKDDATEGGNNLKDSVAEAGNDIESSLERGGEKLVEKVKEASFLTKDVEDITVDDIPKRLNSEDDYGNFLKRYYKKYDKIPADILEKLQDAEEARITNWDKEAGKHFDDDGNKSDAAENLKEATEQQKHAAETQRQAATEQNKAATKQNHASDDQSNAANKQEQAANKQEQAAVTEVANAGVPTGGNSGGASGNIGLKGKLAALKGTPIGASFFNGLSQSIGPAVITAFTTALSGGDFVDALKNAGITILSVVVPEVLTAIAPYAIGAISGPAGWVTLAIAAIGTAIYAYEKKRKQQIRETEEAELKRLSNIEDANKALEQKQTTAVDDNKKTIKDQKKLQEDINTYSRFHNNAFLTDENQEKLNSAIEDLNSNFSTVVSAYDEATQTLEINTNAIDNLSLEYQQQREENLKTIAASGQQQTENYTFQMKKANQILNNMKNLSDWYYGAGQDGINYTSADDKERGTNFYEITQGYGQGYSDVVTQIMSAAQNLNAEQEQTILAELNSSLDTTVDSFDDLAQKLKDGTVGVEEFSSAVKNISNFYNKDEIDKAFRKNASTYLQGMSNETLEIGQQLADALVINLEDQSITVEEQREKDSSKSKNEIMDSITALTGIELGDLSAEGREFGKRKKYSELSDETKATLEGYGIDEAAWSDAGKLGSNNAFEDILRDLEAAAQIAESNSQLFEKLGNKITDERVAPIIQEYSQLQTDMGTMTEEQYQSKLNSIISDLQATGIDGIQEITDALKDSENKMDNTYTQLTKKAESALIKVFPDSSIFENWSLNVKQAVVSQLESMNLSDAEVQKVAEIWKTTLSKYSGQVQDNVANVLSQIDLTEGFSALFANRKQFVEQLEDAGLSTEEAAKIYADYIAQGTNAIVNVLTNTAALKTAFDSFTEGISSSIESNKDILESYVKWTSGEGTYEDLTNLFKTGAEKFTVDKKTGNVKFDVEEIASGLVDELTGSAKAHIDEITKSASYLNVLQNSSRNQYQELLKEYQKGGYSDYASFANDFGIKMQSLGLDQGLMQSITESGQKTVEEYEQSMEEVVAALPKEIEKSAAEIQQALKDQYSSVEDKEEELEDAKRKKAKAERDYQKALRDEKKAHDDLADAIDEEADAYKALQESYYGTEFYDSNLDDLYNYEQRLTSINKKLEKFSSLLEDTSDISSATKAWNGYANAIHEQLATTEAKTQLNQNLADEGKNFLMQKYSQYFSIDDYGKLMPDISLLEDSKIPDAEKDFIGEMIQKVNEYTDAVADGEKEAYDIRKEYQDKLKDLYKNYISLEDNIADVLKKQAEEEVDTQKNKYSQLKEADDDYLDALQDAIDKQRKLRDAENQYEDLAQKQKKLSLMQRDTSGANRKEALSLEEEIKDDQQNLLDQEVDNIIDNMKSLQETQQELRDTEIELKEAVIEETNWSKEANAILKTFTTAEDYVGWMATNDVDFQDMSVDKQVVQMDEWAEQGNQIVNYLATQSENIQTATQTTADEILNIINTTSEGATGSIERDSEKVQTEIAEAQKEAEQAYEDAKEAVIDAKDAVIDAKDNVADAKNNIKDADQAVITATANLDLAKLALKYLSDQAGTSAEDLINYGDELLNKAKTVKSTGNDVNYYQKGQIKANQTQAETRRVADTGKTKHTTATQLLKNLTEEKVGKQAILEFSSDDTLRPIDENIAKKMQQQGTDGGRNAYSKTSDFLLKDKNGKYYITSNERTAEIWGTQGLDRYRFVNTGGGSFKHRQWVKYATGGLVDYTGPAWVDGTKTKPEAFLSATDTENIRQMMDIMNILLSNFSTPSKSTYESSSNVVSPNIEVTVNVDSISSDYDVDQATERVKQNILDAYNKTGNSVILRK